MPRSRMAWREMQAAQAHPAKTAREREYVAALSEFLSALMRGDYQARVEAYAAAMAKLYQDYPQRYRCGRVLRLGAAGFASAPNDDSLTLNHKAMAVLTPLVRAIPRSSGSRALHHSRLRHALACARTVLSAARHYGEIAASAPHAVHMPGHIFARLGMWQADIDANVASVAASHAAESAQPKRRNGSVSLRRFLGVCLSAERPRCQARAVLDDSAAAIASLRDHAEMGEHYMAGMFPYYRTKLPIIFDLEMRDWKSAAALHPSRARLRRLKP